MHINRNPILLIEDSEVDALMVQRAFRKNGVENPLVTAQSVEQAFDILHGKGEQAEPMKPVLILFDLNMPRIGGIEFLRRLRADEALRSLPAVALSSSDQPQDRARAFQLNVAGFFVKPVDYDELVELFGVIARYWQCSRSP